MLHTFRMNCLPRVSAMYHIERQTVWQTCDQENIAVLVDRGKCLFRFNGEEVPAQPNDLVFIPSGQEYQRLPVDDAPASFYYFHFSLDNAPVAVDAEEIGKDLLMRQATEYRSAEPSAFEEELTVCLGPKITIPPEGMAVAAAALSEYEKVTPEGRLFFTLHFANLLAMATRETSRMLLSQNELESKGNIPIKLRSAILYIRSHYERNVTVEEVCRHAGLSHQHVIRLFRQELGVTPIQYINHLRMMHAKDLLWRNINLSIKELAYELGFTDEHYFSRVFTRVVGETPSEFRRRVQSFSSGSSIPE